MSSRNAYLAKHEREIAGKLNVVLRYAVAALERGGGVAGVEGQAAARLMEAGFGKIDYVAVRDAETLEKLSSAIVDRPARLLAAAWIGQTRLIDNFPVKPFA
jgi:pantoate--beta-alanine ligase